jgi:hypothetical protein
MTGMIENNKSIKGRQAYLCLLILLLCNALFAAEARPCPHSDTLVTSADTETRRRICETVQRTEQLMQNYGMDRSFRLQIRTVDSFDGHQPNDIFGRFDSVGYRIEILTLPACMETAKERLPFGLAMSEALHQSFVAHEVAHAVTQWNSKIAKISTAAHEYIAYTFQIMSMSDALRSKILAHIDIEAFEHEDEINDVYYSLNPEYFALKSYRHFMQLKDKQGFIQRLLSGGLRSRHISH